MMRWFGFVLLLSIVSASFGQVFDGKRKGFAAGFGLGSGSAQFQQSVSVSGEKTNGPLIHKTPFVTNFKFGGGIDDQLVLVWNSRVAWFPMRNVLNKNVTIADGVAGLAVNYFLKPVSPSWYGIAGIGYSTWGTPFEKDSKNWVNFGGFAGVGYEFAKFMQVEAVFQRGNPSTEEDSGKYKTETYSYLLTVNVIGY